jgi:ubiquinone/menaquinone biosynthesis C-methylase UbiE
VSRTLEEHLDYVADSVRLERFRAAITKAVRPGAVVVDLGCGSGILGLMCLQAGAARVLAIDSTQMIEVAHEAFQRAGVVNRSDFIRGRSYRIDLPVRADLVICDHVGYFGFDYGIIELLKDARKRFLKPQGLVLPSRIRLVLGAVESDKARKKADGWRAQQVPSQYHWLSAHAVNSMHPVVLSRDEILSAPSEVGIIDLMTDNPDFFSWTTELILQRDGVLNGLAGWFECELIEGVSMTNSPFSGDSIHRPQAFLPIGEAVAVKTGERINATLMARPADDQVAWSVELHQSGRRFSHSTWQGLTLGASDLLRTNPQRVPRQSHAGRARSIVLGYCDGRRTAREIEELVLREHASLFPAPAEISRFVSEVLARDTE